MIREMTREDWPAVSLIYEQALVKGDTTFVTECPSYEDWDRDHSKGHRYVYEEDGVVAGWVVIAPTNNRIAYRGVADLSIYIHNDYQGRGIGTQLLNHLCTETEKDGYWSIQASVFQINDASMALHKKCGFRVIGYREKISKDRFGVWQNTVLMERRNNIE